MLLENSILTIDYSSDILTGSITFILVIALLVAFSFLITLVNRGDVCPVCGTEKDPVGFYGWSPTGCPKCKKNREEVPNYDARAKTLYWKDEKLCTK